MVLSIQEGATSLSKTEMKSSSKPMMYFSVPEKIELSSPKPITDSPEANIVLP
jgi:hypothetical protein